MRKEVVPPESYITFKKGPLLPIIRDEKVNLVAGVEVAVNLASGEWLVVIVVGVEVVVNLASEGWLGKGWDWG